MTAASGLLIGTALVSLTLACLGCGGSGAPAPRPDAAAREVERSDSLRRLAVTTASASEEAKLTRDCLAGPVGPANTGLEYEKTGSTRIAEQFESPPPCAAPDGRVPAMDLDPGDPVTITTGAPAGGVYVTLDNRFAGNDTFADAEPVGQGGQVWRVRVPEPEGLDTGPRLEIGVIPTATDSGGAAFAVGIED